MAKKQRTWTLKAYTTRFTMLLEAQPDIVQIGMNYVTKQADVSTLEEDKVTFVAKGLDGEASLNLTNLWIGEEDEHEVVSWLHDEPKHKFELMHERTMHGSLIHFRFYNLDDALKFKLRFGESLEPGAV